ncbi:hypothetical protein ARMGADRAFT_1037799 [Armillaria gallica]|uniref:Uncharacterized protein n=1 Tax=Armillaria gallica TaxID=47427 RepID=A0A2H3CQF9_ARMGA|nr:hypothetical protein ARMGADRAFT_1037799 [Armillaria gallica]
MAAASTAGNESSGHQPMIYWTKTCFFYEVSFPVFLTLFFVSLCIIHDDSTLYRVPHIMFITSFCPSCNDNRVQISGTYPDFLIMVIFPDIEGSNRAGTRRSESISTNYAAKKGGQWILKGRS